MRLKLAAAAGLGASVLLIACGDEGPVAFDPLVPDVAVSTFEVVLDASAFLAFDTTLTGFFTPAAKSALVFAEDAGGELDAHALVHFERPPVQIGYTNEEGDTRPDPDPIPLGGELTFVLDRDQTLADGDFDFEIHHVVEDWDAETANWTMRVDSVDESLAWTDPGGTVGDLIARATWPGDADTLRLPFDSAMHALWMEDGAVRGIRIASGTPGVRGRIELATLRVEYRPSPRPDTVISVDIPSVDRTFIAHPMAAPNGDLLVGGLPGWRTFLDLNARLDTIQVPCSASEVDCSLPLAETSVNYAALVFETTESPAGYAPLDSLRISAYPVLGAGELPLERAPFGDILTPNPVAVAVDQGSVDVPLTATIARRVSSSGAGSEAESRRIIALVANPEGDRFEIVSFAGSSDGARAPRLRIVYSVIREAQQP